ncbi:hypothetical protein ETB97_010799 [Aspergillus alliaceus]|uniref:Uncharacterized protein n=1 Tax=Petromyces alliaceus TaxID=209559 RepID=A0A5N7BRP5_PETAA|nr:uncharacterized protein BDW43DRAFT_313871 [Aspergillus alliaceus]KAB8230610.1 hypothetical protein BDW43DRAFT_313871 [Aspergillus alliaceus]KAE8384492.1 hypothetical protein BDV23DRAFT_189174 [Aspergillus alliaceus]KAF5866700.1 hypothetical protein ETB97_010799 [Aspergillus burnettii]
MKLRSSSTRGRLSARYISTLCLFVTGIYGQMIGQPGGIDTGNTLCLGTCVSSIDQLNCQAPALPIFRVTKNCYTCCYGDDDSGDWADAPEEES